MSRSIERQIPWPEGRRFTEGGWQKGPSFENFLKRQGIEINSSIPPLDKRLLERFYRYRQKVTAGVIEATAAARCFERLVAKTYGEKAQEFYERNSFLIALIRENVK